MKLPHHNRTARSPQEHFDTALKFLAWFLLVGATCWSSGEAAQQRSPTKQRTRPVAFTLIEVMIAVAIFFMAMFTILGVLSTGLHAASILRNSGPTAGMIAGQLSLTNKLEEGSASGNFGDIPYYDGYRWTSQTVEAATNGLFRVDFVVYNKEGKPDSTLSVLFYRPESQSSHMGLH